MGGLVVGLVLGREGVGDESIHVRRFYSTCLDLLERHTQIVKTLYSFVELSPCSHTAPMSRYSESSKWKHKANT